MRKREAHQLLNAAKAGFAVSSAQISEALMATGDMRPCKRRMQEVEEVTHAVPTFAKRYRDGKMVSSCQIGVAA